LDEALYGLVGNGPHFVVGAVLNRMLDKHARRVEAEGSGLCNGGIDERLRCNKDTGKAAALKVGDVMHTA